MHRTIMFFFTVAFVLAACNSSPENKTPPAQITTAPETASIPATQLPSPAPSTQPPATPSAAQAGWLSQLETISPHNWARLRLLQTFPAEMPMSHSTVVSAPDGKTLLMGSSDQAQFFFLDLQSGRLSGSFYAHDVKNPDTPFRVIKYLADGSLLASADSPAMIYHLDGTGKILFAWEGTDFAVSSDQQTMAIDANGGTSLINIADHNPVVQLQNTNGAGYSFSPDNSKIAIDAVTVDAASVDVWDIKSQTILHTLHNMYEVSYSPDGKFLVVLDTVDNSLRVFSPDGATQLIAIPDTHSDYLISPDGSLITYQTASGSSVAVDTSSWQSAETTLRGIPDSFSADGHILVTRTDDRAILVWGVLKGNG